MFGLYDNVIIKANGLHGTIVDISKINGKTTYVVESDVEYVHGGYGDRWKLFDCSEAEIEKIK